MNSISYGREAVRNQGFTMGTGLVGRVKSYLVRSKAERQLSQLDDRQLEDIGLKRSEISKTVWGS